jgi:CMP-N,N'-diacetyllegionaminic acid synthase
MQNLKSVAFIPARSGSKRVPDKNIKILNGHPMLAFSIRAAIESGCFDSVICATDNELYADIARYYGAKVPALRPPEISADKSPDIDWLIWIFNLLEKSGYQYDLFAILRPTSPFRLPSTIRRAIEEFLKDPSADSLRAIRKCREHPGKMWVKQGMRILPLLPFSNGSVPWHSSQYSSLPEIFVQDASLEVAWYETIKSKGGIAGQVVIPFISQNLEGFDINEPEDIHLAEEYIKSNGDSLISISIEPYKFKK